MSRVQWNEGNACQKYSNAGASRSFADTGDRGHTGVPGHVETDIGDCPSNPESSRICWLVREPMTHDLLERETRDATFPAVRRITFSKRKWTNVWMLVPKKESYTRFSVLTWFRKKICFFFATLFLSNRYHAVSCLWFGS